MSRRNSIATTFSLCTALLIGLGCSTHKLAIVTSDPNGAAIYLNGAARGITPFKEDLTFTREIDSYEVLLKKAGYFDGKTTIRNEPKDKHIYEVTLSPLSKTVSITSEPKGATVYVNGTEAGITDLTRKMEFHEFDEYEVVVKLEGYLDAQDVIQYEPATKTEYPFTLEKIETVPVELVEMEPIATPQGVKLRIVRKPTLAYLEVIERSPNVKSVTLVTNNEDETISLGPPILSPKGSTLVYEAFVEENNSSSYSNIWKMDVGAFGKTRVTFGKWLDTFPTFTPDANSIVFSSDRVGGRTLWRIKTMGGGGLTSVTNTLSEDYSPSVSPDATVITYASNPPEAEEPQIWTVNSDGSLPTQLREGESPQISPDGKQILFVRRDKITGKRQIWIMNNDGNEETQLTQNVAYDVINPRWSPDGRWIVFASEEGLDSKKRPNFDIWMMTRGGAEKTQLTTNGSRDDCPCWDHSGRYIYFRSNRGGTWNIWRFEPSMPETASTS
ncbi:MAG TPA: PEGA domain-containing protein [Sedimentisphaerales bacterium]|jgi:hypothetical protein|nr:PEGA domain-containing protein [Sedimentisphaerales bacterium]HNU29086.1 PEGA domain-containing protein [Sedimentisphaerales bacterium]